MKRAAAAFDYFVNPFSFCFILDEQVGSNDSNHLMFSSWLALYKQETINPLTTGIGTENQREYLLRCQF